MQQHLRLDRLALLARRQVHVGQRGAQHAHHMAVRVARGGAEKMVGEGGGGWRYQAESQSNHKCLPHPHSNPEATKTVVGRCHGVEVVCHKQAEHTTQQQQQEHRHAGALLDV